MRASSLPQSLHPNGTSTKLFFSGFYPVLDVSPRQIIEMHLHRLKDSLTDSKEAFPPS